MSLLSILKGSANECIEHAFGVANERHMRLCRIVSEDMLDHLSLGTSVYFSIYGNLFRENVRLLAVSTRQKTNLLNQSSDQLVEHQRLLKPLQVSVIKFKVSNS